MLTDEQASAKLEALKIDGWVEDRTRAFLGTPLGKNRVVRALYAPPEDAAPRDSDEVDRDLGLVFEAMTAGERRELFELWFPKLAPVMEHAWQALARRPCESPTQEGRKPFRTPRNQRLLGRSRAGWFRAVCDELEGHDQDAAWVADWCSHLESWPSDTISWLLAGAIDGGGTTSGRVLDSLLSIIRGTHDISSISGVAIRALLCCSNPEAWEAVEKLLLAAKREEGLRQSILESVDEAHPDAFRRMLRAILEHGLCRFSATVRAADVWFGFQWDAIAAKVVEEAMEKTARFLDDEGARAKALDKGSAQDAYLALWATAFEDFEAAFPFAQRLTHHKDPDRRYAAYHMLAQSGLDIAEPVLRRGLSDEDLRVATCANDFYRPSMPEGARREVFGPLEALLLRIPKKMRLKPILWPWTGRNYEPAFVGVALVQCISEETAERLIPHLARVGTYVRASVAAWLGGLGRYGLVGWDEREENVNLKPISGAARKALLGLLGDPSPDVRKAAFAGMHDRPLEADEVEELECLLDRKASDLRARVIGRLVTLPDGALLASAERLTAGGRDRRAAGFEAFRVMVERKRSVERVRAAAARARDSAGKLTEAEQTALAVVFGEQREEAGARDVFGLLDESKLTRPGGLRAKGLPRITPAAWGILLELDRLVDENKTVEVPQNYGEEPVLLGGAGDYRSIAQPHARGKSLEEDRARFPLPDVFLPWYANRPAHLRDADVRELVRAFAAFRLPWGVCKALRWSAVAPDPRRGIAERTPLRYAETVGIMINWLIRVHPDETGVDELLDGAEDAGARGRFLDDAAAQLKRKSLDILPDGRLDRPMSFWIAMVTEVAWSARPLTDAEKRRFLTLELAGAQGLGKGVDGPWPDDRSERWRIVRKGENQGLFGAGEDGRFEPESFKYQGLELFDGIRLGVLTTADLLRYLVARDEADNSLGWMGSPKWDGVVPRPPEAMEAIRRLGARIVEIELRRGEAATDATPYITQVAHTGGLGTLVAAASALGRAHLVRNPRYKAEGRADSLSHIIMNTRAEEGEGADSLGAPARAAGIGEDRLVEIGVFAPQWAAHVERALGWTGFEDAVWWIHAHTKGNDWQLDDAVREMREARIAERTPIPEDELTEGAVDAAWFARVHGALGPERWERVYAAAKYACSGIGHKRAQLFADAMIGEAKETELIKRITLKRHQDTIRALGLAPLKRGDPGRTQVQGRYRVMQEIRRTSRKHGGSMLQTSERRAVEIGLDNLARTAGYPDPLRLAWALETEAVADLAKGPVSASHGKGDKRVTVTLGVDAEGAAEVSAARGDKPIKSIPPEVKKAPEIAALIERSRELKKSGSRMRQGLEAAMCRGDEFTGEELRGLWTHPVLRPMLARLVFVGAGDTPLMGYPEREARVLRDHAGELEPLKGSDRLRVAHPHDLLRTDRWERWQRECFGAERVQPFKQVFRELYVPSAKEGPDATKSTRYAGHQVQPRQAMALLGGRQWVARPEEGVQKTFHKERITARLEFEESFFTPAEVEGLTLSSLRFTAAGKWEDLAFSVVPPRLFSEVMRDLDLVVSVAHRGGVDPEASESTVELRAALLRETCTLLEIANISIEKSRATIRGQRATYSLHLGSGTVQMLPGGSLHIVPVHSQHRGRLFLPFADNDPKTAEIMSKAILLARDTEIQDPSIAQQITRGAR